jgi:hypothetical protein
MEHQTADGFVVLTDLKTRMVVWGYKDRPRIGEIRWTRDDERSSAAKTLRDGARRQGLVMALKPEEVWLLCAAADAIDESIYADPSPDFIDAHLDLSWTSDNDGDKCSPQ